MRANFSSSIPNRVLSPQVDGVQHKMMADERVILCISGFDVHPRRNTQRKSNPSICTSRRGYSVQNSMELHRVSARLRGHITPVYTRCWRCTIRITAVKKANGRGCAKMTVDTLEYDENLETHTAIDIKSVCHAITSYPASDVNET